MTETRDTPQSGDDDASTDPEHLVSQRHYDPDDAGDLTTVIIAAVAEAEGVEVTAVTDPLLYDTIDAEALELSLFDSSDDDLADRGRVQFDYHGFVVTVGSDGWVKVYEDDAD